MHVHIHEAGRDDAAGCVDDVLAFIGLEMLADVGDDSVANAQVAQGIERGGGIDDSAGFDEKLQGQTPLAFTRKSKTAMRTATP
jgi:hypothetical protein